MATIKTLSGFQSSFSPLTVSLRIFGIPFSIPNSTNKSSHKIIILVALLGCCIIVGNGVFNGPRGIDVGRLNWMKMIQKYESPYAYFKDYPFGLIALVKVISDMVFFLYVPIIHLTFIIMVLWSTRWKGMALLFEEILEKFELNEGFYRKCRKLCFSALFLLTMVEFKQIMI